MYYTEASLKLLEPLFYMEESWQSPDDTADTVYLDTAAIHSRVQIQQIQQNRSAGTADTADTADTAAIQQRYSSDTAAIQQRYSSDTADTADTTDTTDTADTADAADTADTADTAQIQQRTAAIQQSQVYFFM
jgi:hypothetical protein